MISIEKLREAEPAFNNITDEEVERIRELLYKFAKLALEIYIENREGSKNPLGSHGLPVIDM